jgi:hypothetical protein
MVRNWARQDIAAITADVGAVGRSAVEASARETARLGAQDGSEEARRLAMLAGIVDAVCDPPRRRWSFFRSSSARTPTSISDVVAMIERERDAAMRKAMTMRTDRRRLEAADDGLEEALALIGLLDAGAVAVAREVAGDDPTRAAMLRTEVGAMLSARRGDLQLQLLVLRQAVATHDLISDGQTALADALDRARNVTVGAAQTAIAARRAVGVDRLPGTGPAGNGTPLSDAVAELHAAIDRRERG